MLGKAVKHIASSLAGALLLVMMTVAGANAQATTGKIQGRVVSSDGQPIASALNGEGCEAKRKRPGTRGFSFFGRNDFKRRSVSACS